MRIGRLVLCGLLTALSSGCGPAAAPTLTMRGSTPCPPQSGAIETWCDDVGNCEFRVTTGGVFPCVSAGSAECQDAVMRAFDACLAGGVSDGGPVDAGPVDAGSDAGPLTPTDEVDLLFVLDDTSSMSEEQPLLAAEMERLARILTAGDLDGDGTPEFAPARSLHVGVVSADLGLGSDARVTSCTFSGDDGILATRGASTSGCSPAPSGIFEFEAGRDDPATFGRAVGCVVALGTNGCGFQQELEATMRAISPAPVGHGGPGGANEGFLRPGSVLAVVVATDGEDCSAGDPGLFDPRDERYGDVDFNLRCHYFPGALYGVPLYVDGLTALREDPRHLVFGAIVGVPVDAVEAGSSYAEMLDSAALQERVDPAFGNRLSPSCAGPNGTALPPRRIVQLAQGLQERGAHTTVQSICDSDYAGVVDAIAARIGDALGD